MVQDHGVQICGKDKRVLKVSTDASAKGKVRKTPSNARWRPLPRTLLFHWNLSRALLLKPCIGSACSLSQSMLASDGAFIGMAPTSNMDRYFGASRVRRLRGLFILLLLGVFVSVWCTQTAAAQAGATQAGAGLRMLRTFFPSIHAQYTQHAYETPVRERSFGGNRSDAPFYDQYGPLHVIVISDLNSSYGSTDYRTGVHDAVQEIIARRPDVVISAGDMVAGQRHGLDYRAMWQGFHDAVTLPLKQAGIPLLVTAGNHDGPRTPRYAYQRELYIDEWTRHKPKVTFIDDTHYPEFYAVAMGATFIVAIDASTVGALDTEQMRWLERQLRAAEDFPVKIVFGHVPMWAVSRGREREIIGDDELEALFEKYRVDGFIAGYDHAYYPGVRGTVRYISTPALGTGLRHLLAPKQQRSPRGFVEFFTGVNGGIYDLESWKVPDFQEIDDRATLPMKVGSGRAPLVRDDLVEMDRRSTSFRHGGVITVPVDPRAVSEKDLRSLAHPAPSKAGAPRDKTGRPARRSNESSGQRALPADLFRD